MAEIFERLREMEDIKQHSAGYLVRRLATLVELSPRGFLKVLRFGSGDMAVVLASYAEQTNGKHVTRQAMHHRWHQEFLAVRRLFPEIAALIEEARESINHHEDAMSKADALRSSSSLI